MNFQPNNLPQLPGPAPVRRGVSGLFLLGVLFLALKLFKVVSWSWWLVLLPFYLLPGLVVFALSSIAGAFVAAYLYNLLRMWRIEGGSQGDKESDNEG